MLLRRASPIVVLLALTGCPDSGKGAGDAANVNSGVPMAGKIPKKPRDPKSVEAAKTDQGFPHDALVELYKAEQTGDESVKRKYGLVDAKGVEVAARRDEYEAALRKFAEEHGEELSRIADELEAARVTSGQPTDVQKK